MKTCKLCNTPLGSEDKIYCNEYCRGRYWRLNNKSRISRYQKRYRLKTPLLCKHCKLSIPDKFRKCGVVFCSDKCRKEGEKLRAKVRRQTASQKFGEYKRRIGCQQCGYNKNPACLDFHHKDGKEKERRITAGLWNCNTELFKEELKKCKLLCKNCHYDLHHPNIENGDL